MLGRIVNKCIKPSVDKWECDHIQNYDAAAKGSSALEAAAYRNLLADVSLYNGEEVIAVFNDFDIF